MWLFSFLLAIGAGFCTTIGMYVVFEYVKEPVIKYGKGILRIMIYPLVMALAGKDAANMLKVKKNG